MRWVLLLLGMCVALTVLRAALAVLLIVLALSLLWGLFFRPAHCFGCGALLLFAAVLQTHTLAVLLVIGFLGFIALVRRPVNWHGCASEQKLIGSGADNSDTGSRI